ncbi:hypothetical protein ANCDUO_07830 [Ancylostoma duodenale]|uniref:Methyltransferase FkbM domain-containing protein n=1 Tax=Ancylostoma duodenale TaxID=51022 RepID=A0A0C2GL17_9BILA|nr:hypothetical protein ANCDUO_07830 [Ancylostoma duodenale]
MTDHPCLEYHQQFQKKPSVIVTLGIGHDTAAEEALLKVYDDLWIDAEGAEYEMFPYFYRGGKLDQYGLTLCQFNMEVHYPDDAKKKLFHTFIFEILRGNRYAFFRPVQGAHMRKTN